MKMRDLLISKIVGNPFSAMLTDTTYSGHVTEIHNLSLSVTMEERANLQLFNCSSHSRSGVKDIPSFLKNYKRSLHDRHS